MYTIRGVNGTDEFDIYDPRDPSLYPVLDAVLSEDINKVPSFKFSVPVTNDSYKKIVKLQTEIVVFDMDGEIEIFRGRCITDTIDFYNTKNCVCEGALAYLLDSKQPPYLHTGSLSVYIKMLLDNHNAKVSDKQKIYVGNVTVTDPNGYMRRESEKDYESPLNIIQEKIVDSYGGLLRIRRTNDKNYLDYLKDYPASDQVARFGENILDLTKFSKAESVRTVIIPLGAEDEETGKQLKIDSVNDGKDYLIDVDLESIYGWIEDTIEFKDVTLPENLKKKGQEYLNDCKHMSLTIELNAVDARLIGLNVRKITPGMMVMVMSAPHGLNAEFVCVSKITNLLEPDKDEISLGNEIKKFTDTINKDKIDADNKVATVNKTLEQQIQATKDAFTEAMNNAGGLYKSEVIQDDGSTVFYYHNKQNIKDSDILMVFNNLGFGVSADGGTNWYGLQVNGDFIANILSVTGVNANWINTGQLSANYIKGGILRLGGAGNTNGRITLYDDAGAMIGRMDLGGVFINRGNFDVAGNSGSDMRVIVRFEGGYTGMSSGSVVVDNSQGTGYKAALGPRGLTFYEHGNYYASLSDDSLVLSNGMQTATLTVSDLSKLLELI